MYIAHHLFYIYSWFQFL